MTSPHLENHARALVGAMRTLERPVRISPMQQPAPGPFITISRQPGAGTKELADAIAARLNEGGLEPPWTCWDRALVEKVATDYRLSERLIETLEETDSSWLTDLFGSMGATEPDDEAKIYFRVARTIRALARQGRVIIVGRGGVFITRTMPAGIHIRLVAPFDHRAAHMAAEEGISLEQAAAHVRDMEKRRDAFHHRHWPDRPLVPEAFHVTFNTARVPVPVIVSSICAMVHHATPQPVGKMLV